MYCFKRRNFAPACTDDFDVPVYRDNRPKDFRGDASERTAVFHLKEQLMFSFASSAALNQWFEISSTFEVLLICKELKYRGTVF
jgi:predicted lipase